MRHNNRSPNPFNWEPLVFFTVWGLLVLALLPWLLSL